MGFRDRAARLGLPLVLAAVLLSPAACRREEPKPRAPAAPAAAPAPQRGPSPAAVEKAQQLYTTECAPCHGVRGAANGPRSHDLVPEPRNFQDPEWQHSVQDDYLERIIVEGGAAVGKSDVMPAFPALRSQPEEVTALRLLLRSFSE
jgi:mono/diheme cytochrome c family protein